VQTAQYLPAQVDPEQRSIGLDPTRLLGEIEGRVGQ
jgi:hypothetical protein